MDCALEESVLVMWELEAGSCVEMKAVLLDMQCSMIARYDPSGFSVVT